MKSEVALCIVHLITAQPNVGARFPTYVASRTSTQIAVGQGQREIPDEHAEATINMEKDSRALATGAWAKNPAEAANGAEVIRDAKRAWANDKNSRARNLEPLDETPVLDGNRTVPRWEAELARKVSERMQRTVNDQQAREGKVALLDGAESVVGYVENFLGGFPKLKRITTLGRAGIKSLKYGKQGLAKMTAPQPMGISETQDYLAYGIEQVYRDTPVGRALRDYMQKKFGIDFNKSLDQHAEVRMAHLRANQIQPDGKLSPVEKQKVQAALKHVGALSEDLRNSSKVKGSQKSKVSKGDKNKPEKAPVVSQAQNTGKSGTDAESLPDEVEDLEFDEENEIRAMIERQDNVLRMNESITSLGILAGVARMGGHEHLARSLFQFAELAQRMTNFYGSYPGLSAHGLVNGWAGIILTIASFFQPSQSNQEFSFLAEQLHDIQRDLYELGREVRYVRLLNEEMNAKLDVLMKDLGTVVAESRRVTELSIQIIVDVQSLQSSVDQSHSQTMAYMVDEDDQKCLRFDGDGNVLPPLPDAIACRDHYLRQGIKQAAAGPVDATDIKPLTASDLTGEIPLGSEYQSFARSSRYKTASGLPWLPDPLQWLSAADKIIAYSEAHPESLGDTEVADSADGPLTPALDLFIARGREIKQFRESFAVQGQTLKSAGATRVKGRLAKIQRLALQIIDDVMQRTHETGLVPSIAADPLAEVPKTKFAFQKQPGLEVGKDVHVQLTDPSNVIPDRWFSKRVGHLEPAYLEIVKKRVSEVDLRKLPVDPRVAWKISPVLRRLELMYPKRYQIRPVVTGFEIKNVDIGSQVRAVVSVSYDIFVDDLQESTTVKAQVVHLDQKTILFGVTDAERLWLATDADGFDAQNLVGMIWAETTSIAFVHYKDIETPELNKVQEYFERMIGRDIEAERERVVQISRKDKLGKDLEMAKREIAILLTLQTADLGPEEILILQLLTSPALDVDTIASQLVHGDITAEEAKIQVQNAIRYADELLGLVATHPARPPTGTDPIDARLEYLNQWRSDRIKQWQLKRSVRPAG